MRTQPAMIALTLLAIAAPASAQNACLRQDQIYNWNAPNDTSLIVEDNLHQKFKVTLMGVCQNLTFHQTLAFKTFNGTALACVSPGDQVLTGSDIGPQTCPINSIVAYTPDMEKADKAAKAAKDAAAPSP